MMITTTSPTYLFVSGNTILVVPEMDWAVAPEPSSYTIDWAYVPLTAPEDFIKGVRQCLANGKQHNITFY